MTGVTITKLSGSRPTARTHGRTLGGGGAEGQRLMPRDMKRAMQIIDYVPRSSRWTILSSLRNHRAIVARTVAAVLLREYMHLTHTNIAAILGGRDHTTIGSLLQKWDRIVETGPLCDKDKDILDSYGKAVDNLYDALWRLT